MAVGTGRRGGRAEGTRSDHARAPTPEPRVPRLTGAGRVSLLSVGMAAVAAPLYLGPLRGLQAPVDAFHLPWWSLAIMFAVAEVFVVHLEFRRSAISFSPSEIPLVLGLFFADPGSLLLGHVVGSSLALAVYRRQSPLKLAFNVGLLGLGTTTAALVFAGVTSLGDPAGPVGWLAAFAATHLVDVLGTIMVTAAISLSEGRRQPLVGVIGFGTATTFGNTCLGLLASIVLSFRPAAWWMVAVVAGILLVAYRAYGGVRQKHERLEVLYESARVAQRTGDLEAFLPALLAQVRDMFRAEIAEITLFPEAEGQAARHSRQGADGTTELMQPLTLDPREGVWARVAAEGRTVLLPKPIRNDRLARHYAGQGILDAMVAPLKGKAGIVGVLLVGNRLGELRTFQQEDVAVLETLANQASIALENWRLLESLRATAEENEYAARHDALTDLPNRTAFLERARAAIDTDVEEAGLAAVMLMDLDRFKEVNDTLGHHNGDLLLQEIGRRLRAVMAGEEVVARLGGDEFAVILPTIQAPESAEAVARSVAGALARPFVLGEVTLSVEVSIGIATFPRDGRDAETLLQRADVAMYQAKQGRTGVERYDAERDSYSPDRLGLVTELRHAIESEQLFLAYQPKLDLSTASVTAVEALARWEHPKRGFVPPDEFVAIAEHTGLIGPLTDFVLSSALAQCRAWERAGLELRVAVNVSARSLLDPNFVDNVDRALRTHDVTPSSLVVEITESSIMADPERSVAALTRLSRMGVGLSIDDFGTGYSSLSHLQRLPIDEIKIDRSFVMGMATDEKDAAIVRSTVELGHNLGLSVVAEGVETQAALERLREMSCDTAQGYLISRPVPAGRLTEWLRMGGFQSQASWLSDGSHSGADAPVVPLSARAQRR